MITQFHGRTEAINIIYRTQNEVFINFKTLVAFYNSIMIAAMLRIGKRAISIITKHHVTFTETLKTRYSPSKFGSNY